MLINMCLQGILWKSIDEYILEFTNFLKGLKDEKKYNLSAKYWGANNLNFFMQQFSNGRKKNTKWNHFTPEEWCPKSSIMY